MKVPWSWQDWQFDSDIKILQWIAKAQHGALLYEKIRRSGFSEERAQTIIRFLSIERALTSPSLENIIVMLWYWR